MSAMRHEELIVEATENRQSLHLDFVAEHTEHLLIERILRHTIEMIQTSLRRPTDIQSRSNMGMCPVEHFRDFFPIVHVLIRHLLYRSTCNNHTIELLFFQNIEVVIERLHVFYRCILRSMALELHEGNFQLKRRIREQTNKVGLGRNLNRHQIEDDNLQRTDVL